MKDYVFKDGLMSVKTGYNMYIERRIFDNWVGMMIEGNTSIIPEVIGFLLGKAEGVYTPVECALCSEYIKKGEESTHGQNKSSWLQNLHDKCTDKYIGI